MKAALVLSGGGSKGAFQVGAEQFLRKRAAFEWTVVSGVSAGALNGAMIAGHKFIELERLWLEDLHDDRVYKGNFNLWTVMKILFNWQQSLYDNSPLLELLKDHVSFDLKVPFTFGAVKLEDATFTRFFLSDTYEYEEEHERYLRRMLLASTAIPIVWEPVQNRCCNYVDGGLLQNYPIGAILKYEPQMVVTIGTRPELPVEEGFDDIVPVGKRAWEIALEELFYEDVKNFDKVNRLVRQAQEQGAVLKDNSGNPYQYIEHLYIEPPKDLGDGMDFHPELALERIKMGWNAAAEAYGEWV